ncbi:hypothetical protein Tco_0362986 [Tanacetum coccineum]
MVDTMANVNFNAPTEQSPAMAPPTRTNEQILPRSRWVPVGKRNYYLDVERSQSNPIYKISVDILKHTNFFRAFIASSTIPSIYIQQFWDTVRYDKTTGSYSCQLDEQWGTKQEVFGMPIPNNLITADIQGEQYCNSYLEKVTKHQRYLAGEEVSDPDSPAPKLAKATKPKAAKKSKPSVPKAAPVTKPAASNSAPTEPLGHDESSSLYAKLGLTDSETESDEEVPGIDARDQDEGQAAPNPGIQDEGQAGSNPGEAAVSQPQPSHVVHAGPNLEHMDVEENLKLPTEDQVRLEEPTNSAGTLSSLQNLDKEFSFTNQFLEEKS